MINNILVIDDEPDIRQLLSITLSRMGFSSHCVENLAQSFQALNEHDFQLCLTDLKLPDGSGLDFVKKVQTEYPKLPVIVITAHGSMDIAIQAMKHGAFDFINKPVDLQHLRALISNALSSQHAFVENAPISEIIGDSTTTQQLKEKINKVSKSQAPVFISGESGSGKELVARAIHQHSSRKDQTFIAVNCGAIPTELMESEFFGHSKGSFTGAHQDKKGLFQAANGGTLLLDEIADLPLDMQVKLLRVIQEKTIRPIGSPIEMPIDVRILSATHQNLPKAVEEGIFRNDLFYRVNVIEIVVPPLRERVSDIELISNAILTKIAQRNSSPIHTITASAIHTLKTYAFPGNIRELENILERACVLAEQSVIDTEDLVFSKQPTVISLPTIPIENATTNIEGVDDPSLSYDPSTQSIDDYLDGIEKNILLRTLERNRWNRTATAKTLGLTFRSLRYRLKKLEIEVDIKE
ncbi:MAG: two-component system response regulator PilR (NtrC family) [Candidatus Endobugula sp.]|jgi:two-component system response regulator PilR (NtrC family)